MADFIPNIVDWLKPIFQVVEPEPKKMRKIRIECGWTDGVFAVIETKHFTDWYDFADWLQQRNLSGAVVAIYHWEYVDS